MIALSMLNRVGQNCGVWQTRVITGMRLTLQNGNRIIINNI
jgi:hypothetical protein